MRDSTTPLVTILATHSYEACKIRLPRSQIHSSLTATTSSVSSKVTRGKVPAARTNWLCVCPSEDIFDNTHSASFLISGRVWLSSYIRTVTRSSCRHSWEFCRNMIFPRARNERYYTWSFSWFSSAYSRAAIPVAKT